jgi:cytoskeleton protein RodZ
MASFGDRLREERERRGISLDEIAKATKVGPHLLEALERNDLASLPGGPFNKGFVRAYARHIGLDPEATVDEYAREERTQGLKSPDADRELLREMSRLVELRRDGERKTLVLDWSTVKRVGLAVLFVVVVAFGGWYWLTSGEPGDETQMVASGAPAATPEPDATVAAAAELSATTTSAAESSPPDDSMPEPVAAAANREPAGQQPDAGEPASTSPAAVPAEDLPEQTATATFGSPPEQTAAQTTPPPRAEPETRPSEPPVTAAATPEPAASQSTPPPPPPTPSRSLEIDSGSHITVADAGVGTRVSGRELVGRGDRFPEGARVYFWTRATGGNRGDAVRHVWLRDGRYVVAYDLTIGGVHWRNWTRKTLSDGSVGRWTVEARDAEDRVLARVEFDCVPPATP